MVTVGQAGQDIIRAFTKMARATAALNDGRIKILDFGLAKLTEAMAWALAPRWRRPLRLAGRFVLESGVRQKRIGPSSVTAATITKKPTTSRTTPNRIMSVNGVWPEL